MLFLAASLMAAAEPDDFESTNGTSLTDQQANHSGRHQWKNTVKKDRERRGWVHARG